MRAQRLSEGPVPAERAAHWLLLWDGECGFCRRSVAAVLRRDRRGVLAAAPYQECLDWLPEPVRSRSPEQAHLRSPEGRYWGGGAAVTRVLGLLGHRRLERVLDTAALRPVMAWGYRWVARHRGLLGRAWARWER